MDYLKTKVMMYTKTFTLSTAICLRIGFYLLLATSLMLTSCGKKEEPAKTVETTTFGDTSEYDADSFFEEDSGDTEGYTDYTEDANTESNTTEDYESTDYTSTDYTSSSETDYSSSSTSRSSSNSYQSNTSTTSPPPSTSTSSGSYLIVAGSYLVENNANQMVSKLRNKGYNAERVIFDLSQYHTVLAGRYSTQSAARQAASKLKSQGIDCYVMRQRN